MAKIYIKDLQLRTIIGTNDWERDNKQDITINVEIEYDASKAIISDKLKDTLDYKKITKEIIKKVEASNFFLLEKLTGMVLKIVMSYPRIKNATVKIDKPHALRFAKSVSVELYAQK